VYRHVPRSEILAALAHLRELHRQISPSNDRERYAFERRELVTKNLLSNLRRTGDHPTLSMLLEIADMFSLTVEGAHRLFGYDLDGIREYDLRLNGGRTHIERPHKRLRSGEIHRSLGVRNARECERDKCRPQHTRCVGQFASEEGLRQSLGKVGCAAGNHDMACTKHRHLHRLVSVGNMP
jgi:hypothetical protein